MGVYLMFTYNVMAREEKRYLSAMVRSHALVRGVWWSLFFRLFVVNIIVFIVAFVIGLVLGIAGGNVAVDVIGNILAGLVSMVGMVMSFYIVGRLYQVRAAAVSPEAHGPRVWYIICMVLGPVAFLATVALVGMASFFTFMALDDAREEGQLASVQMQITSARSMAEIYYNSEGSFSYEGVCGELLPMISDQADRTACNADEDAYALTATVSGETWCVDSLGTFEEIDDSLGVATVCPVSAARNTMDERIDALRDGDRPLTPQATGTGQLPAAADEIESSL
jgi:ABC-type transport system involved in multi-copper enzyme maturation permease subunit